MNESKFIVQFPTGKVMSTSLVYTKGHNSVFFVTRNSLGNLECIEALFSLVSLYTLGVPVPSV